LNVNLYDLLDWFRNPSTATRPQQFDNVAALGTYSYVNNKVFPLFEATASRIAQPLLRKIAQFKQNKRSFRPNSRRIPRTKRAKVEASSEVPRASVKKSKENCQETTLEQPNGHVVSASTGTATPSDDTANGERSVEPAPSLFAVPEAHSQNTLVKKRISLRKRRGSGRPQSGNRVEAQGGQLVEVAA
jgi:hypothetical protein